MFPIGDENRSQRRAIVNYALLISNIAVFFLFWLDTETAFYQAILSYGMIPEYILRGERLWTLLTSIFMHADPIHLIGNMLYLWVFGDNIEDTLGPVRYLLFYLIGGLAANFAHIASLLAALPTYGYVGFDIPSIGASGAISAVLGGYLILFPKARIRTLIMRLFVYVVNIPAMYYLGFWFLYQLLLGVITLTGVSSGVAFWAHIGGFVFGMALVRAFRRGVPKRAPVAQPRRVVRVRMCPRCGIENPANATFCAYCGTRLD